MSVPQPGPRPRLSPRRRRWLKIGLLAGSTFGSLGAAEFAARWHEEGSFLEAVDSVLGLRTAADPGGMPEMVPDPELGFRFNPARKEFNSLSYRGPEAEVTKKKDRFRIVVVGDSVSYPPYGYVHAATKGLERARPGAIEVINASVHGYTTYQERLFLERYLLKLDPDLVLLQWCVNDNFKFFHRYTSGGRRLMTKEVDAYLLPEGAGVWRWLCRSSYFLYKVRKWLYATKQQNPKKLWENPQLKGTWGPGSWTDAREHFHAMAAMVREKGGRFAVVAVPHEFQLDAELLASERERVLYPQLQLARICAAQAIAYHDPHTAFLAHRDEGLYERDSLHLSKRGHEVMGADLLKFLLASDVLPR